MCPSVCLILLNIMFSVIIHVAANDRTLSFQRLNSVLLSMCSLYFLLPFIYWWMFMIIPYLSFMNVVPVSMGYRCPLNTMAKISFGCIPSSGLPSPFKHHLDSPSLSQSWLFSTPTQLCLWSKVRSLRGGGTKTESLPGGLSHTILPALPMAHMGLPIPALSFCLNIWTWGGGGIG